MHDIFISSAPGTNALLLFQFGTHPMTVTYSNKHQRSKIIYNMIISVEDSFSSYFCCDMAAWHSHFIVETNQTLRWSSTSIKEEEYSSVLS